MKLCVTLNGLDDVYLCVLLIKYATIISFFACKYIKTIPMNEKFLCTSTYTKEEKTAVEIRLQFSQLK